MLTAATALDQLTSDTTADYGRQCAPVASIRPTGWTLVDMIAHLYDPCLPSLEAASRTQLYMTKEQRRQQMSE